MKYCILVGCTLAILVPALAWTTRTVGQPAPATPATAFECRWTATPIKITGKGTDPAWKNAQVIDHFYLPWLGEKARAARTKTKAKLLWDREFLYFFADMEDADLYADIKERDGTLWNNDVFELFFKPAENKPGYYEFQVNPAGAVLDMFIPRRNAGGFQRFVKDGKFNLEAKVNLRGTLNKWTDKDDGWSVEGKIPWTDFLRTGGRPERNEQWKFALCRYDYSVDFEGPELSTCAPLTKSPPSFHAFEQYATLTFVGPEGSPSKTGAPKKFTPMTTSRVVGFPDPPPPYQVEQAYTNMQMPWPIYSTHIPGSDQLLVITLDRSGDVATIHRMKDDQAVKSWDTWLQSTDTVIQIEFHPRWKENGYVYLGGNGPRKSPGKDKKKADEKKTRIVRYTMQTKPPYDIIPNSEKLIIDVVSNGHNGGAPVFGHDGMLYITTGDGTSDSDTNLVGQDMSTLLAKVLRIDVDHPDPGKAYSVPKDNPFVNMKGARPEIWALGLRNPWRMCLDQKTGHLWVGTNGQDIWEQAHLVNKGDNYGWSVMEGGHPFYLNRKAAPVPFVKPTVEHHHSEARSLTGGLVYYGKKYPDLVGHYIYGDYSTGKVWAIKHDGKKTLAHREIADTRLAIAAFATDSKGEILVVDFQKEKGGLFALVPNPAAKTASTFPRKLSESGLFKSVKGHVMEESLLPYSVNSVLWSDGAAKQRWLGLPAGTKIDFPQNRGWELPDQTVIVKSFYIEAEEGNPKSRRWIETRFLTRQGAEWYGYSYAWNDDQSEGVLVDAKGTDREFTIQSATGAVKKLNWHYPSRSECMVCHSRAARYVLGLSDMQFNHDHDFGDGRRENQLAVLERIGLLRVNWTNETRKRLREALEKKGMKESDIKAELARISATKGQREPAASSLLAMSAEHYKRLVDPYDKKQDLNARARSYLHSNCAQCHVEAGGGNAAMEFEFNKTLDQMKIIDVKPQHDTFGIKDARIVAPGEPERSVLLHRIAHRDKGHMPPLATRVVDTAAVELMREWIRGMKK